MNRALSWVMQRVVPTGMAMPSSYQGLRDDLGGFQPSPDHSLPSTAGRYVLNSVQSHQEEEPWPCSIPQGWGIHAATPTPRGASPSCLLAHGPP